MALGTEGQSGLNCVVSQWVPSAKGWCLAMTHSRTQWSVAGWSKWLMGPKECFCRITLSPKIIKVDPKGNFNV